MACEILMGLVISVHADESFNEKIVAPLDFW